MVLTLGEVAAWLVCGLLAGFCANRSVRPGGGLADDIVVGLVAGGVAGTLAVLAGLQRLAGPGADLAVAFGAAVLIVGLTRVLALVTR